MITNFINRQHLCALGRALVAVALITNLSGLSAIAQDGGAPFKPFRPGNLVVSRSVYDNKAGNITPGDKLPPNCIPANCVTATNNGTYPGVFNNDGVDSSFGITSKIFLDQVTMGGSLLGTLEVPNSAQGGFIAGSDQLVTSFSSKSELALNLSTDGQYLTFLGYVAPIGAIDASNTNTPNEIDPTNPVPGTAFRAVAQVDAFGHFHFTETTAYSGNNGRAAILNNANGGNAFYTAGNAGNGGNPQPKGIVLGAGAQIITPLTTPESAQSPGDPTPVGSFNITELGLKKDKIGKDDNFRGLTLFNNVLYFTKGSGSNGVNTVYFIDTTGTACPSGVGLPPTFAVLPTTVLTYNSSTGLQPNNMCILKGFPTLLANSDTGVTNPFGIWFADDRTLYLADEGDGFNKDATLYTHAAASTAAGLQKWVFDSVQGKWVMAYVLKAGLNIGVPYNVPGYPTGNNPANGLPWAPATDGLRNITGGLVQNGGVSIWAVTSTVSGSGDEGADPNRLVLIRDSLKNTDPAVAAREFFSISRPAKSGEVLRGVSFAPGTE